EGREMTFRRRTVGWEAIVGRALVLSGAVRADEPLQTTDDPPPPPKSAPGDKAGEKTAGPSAEEKLLRSFESEEKPGMEIERLARGIRAIGHAGETVGGQRKIC